MSIVKLEHRSFITFTSLIHLNGSVLHIFNCESLSNIANCWASLLISKLYLTVSLLKYSPCYLPE